MLHNCSSHLSVSLYSIPESIPLQSHIVMTNATFYNLDYLHCRGYENKLSECSHGGVGAHSCGEISDKVRVGGAVCYSKSYLKPC